MKDYRTEKDGLRVTIWDDQEGIGLRFSEGMPLQRYTSEVILKDFGITATESGVATVDRVSKELTAYAAQHYPIEFAEMPT